MRTKIRGFTILELLVVVAIIAILAVIAIPNFIGRIDSAKASQELAEIDAVSKAVATYYADKGVYPTLQGKDGTLLQAQPIEGSPHNIDFSSLVPDYLASLPHFSYWWVDYQGKIYHTQNVIGTVSASVFTPATGYTYTLYRPNGTTQVLSAPYTLLADEYILGKDDFGKNIPKISSVFKNEKQHPESPEYTPEAPRIGRYLIVELYDHYDSNGITITELALKGVGGSALNYTCLGSYVSVSAGSCTYWNDGIWNKSNLSDGDLVYTGNVNGGSSTTYFDGGAVNAGNWARFALDLGSTQTFSELNVWMGSPEGRIPKTIKIYVTSTYNYATNVAQRNNTGLTEIGSKAFTGSELSVQKYNILN